MPPIRYPLPTLVALILIALLVWRGEVWTRPLRSSLSARWNRAMEGPPVPSSDHPQVIAGPITRKALLLHDGVEASLTPGGPTAETIRLRMFVDVYDVWPLEGNAEYERVGNRRPMGWVKARDLLPWETRLVVRVETQAGSGMVSAPVLAWNRDHVQVAEWPAGRPWGESVPAARSVTWAELPPDRWGVWLSREEVLALLRELSVPTSVRSPDLLRLRAVLGRMLDDRAISEGDLAEARRFLPSLVFPPAREPVEAVSDRLARINEEWESEASWGGLSFQSVPLVALP